MVHKINTGSENTFFLFVFPLWTPVARPRVTPPDVKLDSFDSNYQFSGWDFIFYSFVEGVNSPLFVSNSLPPPLLALSVHG